MRRFWGEKRQHYLKEFMIQPYQTNFVKTHINEFIELIDKSLKLDGKLTKSFQKVSSRITLKEDYFKGMGPDEVLTFESFYETFTKHMITQTEITFDELASQDEEIRKEAEIAKFKKKADRII